MQGRKTQNKKDRRKRKEENKGGKKSITRNPKFKADVKLTCSG